jgi:hypothetical protein
MLLMNFRIELIFYGEELLDPHPTPKLEDHPIGSQRLLIQYIRSYPPYLEAVSSIRNLRTRHALVTRDPPPLEKKSPQYPLIETRWASEPAWIWCTLLTKLPFLSVN